MKINTKQKKQINKNIIILVILLAILIVGLCFLWQFKFNKPKPAPNTNTDVPVLDTKVDLEPPTVEQKTTVEDQKNTSTNKPLTETTNIQTTITSTNITDDLVQIRSSINGALSDSGSCHLSLTNGDKTVSKTTNTYALASSSTCQGFDINRNELSAGKWTIKLTTTIGSETATATGEIILE